MVTGSQALTARIALGAVAALASVFLTQWRRLRTMPLASFDRTVYGLFAVSRLGTVYADLSGV